MGRFQRLSYPQADVLLVCFSLDNVDTYSNMMGKWIQDVCYNVPDTTIPIVICGLKRLDLVGSDSDSEAQRKDRWEEKLKHEDQYAYEYVSKDNHTQLLDLVKKFGAAGRSIKYFEAAAHTGEGVQEVFAGCVSAVTNPQGGTLDQLDVKVMEKVPELQANTMQRLTLENATRSSSNAGSDEEPEDGC